MEQIKLRAFHGDPAIKQKYITRVKAHAEADAIIKGKYWENGKGCAVGCTIEGNDHRKYETELGIPEVLAHLEDSLFENLPNELAMTFPLRFLEAIPVGVDLSLVFPKLFVWQWEGEHGLKHIQEVIDDTKVYDLCEKVVNLYKRTIQGETVEQKEWDLLVELADRIESGARVGAWARAGARVGAWTRARARAWDWAWVGAGARAWAEAEAGARDWARVDFEKYIIITSEKLLELLKKA